MTKNIIYIYICLPPIRDDDLLDVHTCLVCSLGFAEEYVFVFTIIPHLNTVVRQAFIKLVRKCRTYKYR